MIRYPALEEILRLLDRITKGMLLALWIPILIVLAVTAASNNAAPAITKMVDGIFSSDTTQKSPNKIKKDTSPSNILEEYLSFQRMSGLPIRAVLNFFVTDWQRFNMADKYPHKSSSEDEIDDWVFTEYILLFDSIRDELNEIAAYYDLDPKEAAIDAQLFSIYGPDRLKDQKPKLPATVINWIQWERERLLSKKAKEELIDRLLLVTVLGAFGSMVFLTRDYITMRDTPAGLSAYIFRPVLGMFLALATFVVNVMAYTVLAEGRVDQIRSETLYILAFTAGLLSEQVYKSLGKKAKIALDGEPQKSNGD